MLDVLGFGGNNEEERRQKSPNFDLSKSEQLVSKIAKWGEKIKNMSYDEASEKIIELNKSLGQHDKPWRMPTSTELLNRRLYTGQAKSVPDPSDPEEVFWASDGKDGPYVVDMNTSDVFSSDTKSTYNVMLVHE